MPKTVPIQDNFAAGEISPRLISQINAEAYKKGVKEMTNFIPMAQGPFYRRSGFRYHGQIPGTNGRLFSFPITSTSVIYVILTDLGKMYVATPDTILDDGNVVSNPRFIQGSTNWTDISQNTGYVLFSTGKAQLVPGTTHPTQNRYAGIRQNITLASGAVDHYLSVVTAPNVTQADMRIMVGTSAGGTDILDATVGASITHFEDTIDPDGNTSLWVEIRALENDTGATRVLLEVEVANPATTSLIEFTTPWGPDEIDHIQIGYPPGEDTVYFTSPTDPIQELSFDKTTEAFTFAASTITGAPTAWTTDNYPRAITFFQGRMWVGGTPNEPEMFWGSKSGNYLNFTTGTGAADALEFTMAKKGAIQWMVGAKNLLIGTEFGEHIVTAEAGLVYSGDISVDQQSAYGSAPVQPVQIGNRILYVSPDRRKVRDMGYKWTDDGWVSRDITFSSEHITNENTIRRMAFAQNPGSLLYCVSENNNLVGGTYERGNDIVGWFTGNSDGRLVDVASVDLDGTSTVAALFDRDIESTGTLYFEVCYPAPTGGACVLDSGEVFGGDDSGPDIESVSVPHLKNKTVRVLVDGALHPDITLDANGDGDLQVFGKTVAVGLAFTATARLLPLASTLQIGQSTLPAKKRYNKIYIRIFDSAYPKINGTRPPERSPNDLMDQRVPDTTGDIKVANLGWDQEAEIVIEQDLPLKTQVSGVFGEASQDMLGMQ